MNLKKNELVKNVIFQSLIFLYKKDKDKMEKIIEVENLVNRLETEIEIEYKTKETTSYRIEVGYMIHPKKTLSKIIIKFFDKISKTQNIATKDLYFYEDIFYLIDKIVFKNNKIIFTHKKSVLSEIATVKYNKPIEIDIKQMEII